MSRDFPALVDMWQLVRGRRGFKGTWPLERLARLCESLASPEGEVRFEAQFGSDELGIGYADLHIEAELPLQCQRTLKTFSFPVSRQVRLGLLASETDEAALPDGYEPFPVPEQELVRLTDLVEDELILSLPVVPMSSDEPIEASFGEETEEPEEGENPFAVLADLKKDRSS